ncbi:MAG: MotA/TolQ/ExbB proton channel family protein [Verrucomicrobiota bacterium]
MQETPGRKLALWGAWLQLGGVLGILATVVGMLSAFGTASESGATSAQLLAEEISAALFTAYIGFFIALAGFILIAIAVFAKKYRSPWLFWFLLIYAALLVLNVAAFPVGALLGAALIIFLVIKRQEFLNAKDSRSDPPAVPSPS